MTKDVLLAAIKGCVDADAALATVINAMLTPTATGYLRREESWSVAWVRTGEYSTLFEMGIDPPEHDYAMRHPTADRLEYIQEALAADYVSATAIEAGKVRYTASWRDPNYKGD